MPGVTVTVHTHLNDPGRGLQHPRGGDREVDHVVR